MSNSIYFLPYDSYDVSLENLVLDQPIVCELLFFLILMLDIVLILYGEILLQSLTTVKGLSYPSDPTGSPKMIGSNNLLF